MEQETHCNKPVKTDPCIIVIFGASGDLTARKLMPSLFMMFRKGYLPEKVVVLGCARTFYSDEDFRREMSRKCCQDETRKEWCSFAAILHYQQVVYDEKGSYDDLHKRIAELREKFDIGGNILFDLAVPPLLYEEIGRMLGQAGLALPVNEHSWVRLVVEKPFGRDLGSAIRLEENLHEFFAEEQLYRIDHYLAKETVQNILSFRFANQIFEPIWNRNHIDWIGIISSETLGVEKRAGYYDSSGVLRDMFQNHMMQLFSLIAMEPPGTFTAEAIHDEKVKIFSSVLPFSGDNEDIVLGQYGSGWSEESEVVSYREEDRVAADSRTPTFAFLKLDIDNWRWQGVPFYLVSGKRLKEKCTRLVVRFKEAPLSMFKGQVGDHISGNRLVLSIYPEESITLSIQAKVPGPRLCLRTGDMHFCYSSGGDENVLDAYEKVLLDCLMGDRMLFWRQDGILATWKLLTPILEDCEGERCRIQQLHSYAAGSWGPDRVLPIIAEIVK
ncbi:MAG: glucose-6-phosphate dehydrogenase [Desulfopila sp.]|jgi:glucose-6-phosphate 1-dehydrogenase|nr:glucose-6-phosphate dehydrogenase [Desulfopila sp.]